MCTNYKIIIPTYQENEYLQKCLNWLSTYNYLEKVVVIDDNDDADYLDAEIKKRVKVIYTGGNKWWAGSINLGIKEAFKCGSEFVIMLNSDNFSHENVIAPLIQKHYDAPDAVIIPTVANESGHVCYTGGFYNIHNNRITLFNSGLHRSQLGNKIYNVNYAWGMGIVLPSAIVTKVGFFEEKLPLRADREYWYRCSRAGYRLLAFEDVVVYTESKHSSLNRNKNMYLRKTALYRIIALLLEPFNFRSPVYWKTRSYMAFKYGNAPVISLIRYYTHFYFNKFRYILSRIKTEYGIFRC